MVVDHHAHFHTLDTNKMLDEIEICRQYEDILNFCKSFGIEINEIFAIVKKYTDINKIRDYFGGLGITVKFIGYQFPIEYRLKIFNIDSLEHLVEEHKPKYVQVHFPPCYFFSYINKLRFLLENVDFVHLVHGLSPNIVTLPWDKIKDILTFLSKYDNVSLGTSPECFLFINNNLMYTKVLRRVLRMKIKVYPETDFVPCECNRKYVIKWLYLTFILPYAYRLIF